MVERQQTLHDWHFSLLPLLRKSGPAALVSSDGAPPVPVLGLDNFSSDKRAKSGITPGFSAWDGCQALSLAIILGPTSSDLFSLLRAPDTLPELRKTPLYIRGVTEQQPKT